MRKSGFFPRLALVNLARNRQYYLPYLLSCGGAAAMFYILCFLTWNDLIDTMPGSESLQVILYLGCIVVAIFTAVILLYANSFVMKRRQRELGLYNILGMEKRHIARVMLWETVMTGGVTLAGGLATGILLSKLILLLLLKLVKFPVQMGFSVSKAGVTATLVLFAALFLLALATNLFRLGRSKPVELLHSDTVGEREPKTKRLMTLMGVAALATGYSISIAVKSPLDALVFFFVAVLLVMLGTYCLFTAGSIALLKVLRKNDGFYYQTRHFTAVSGLLYRMKQNAVGLSNICILATMVLVTLSTTVCLYLGSEELLLKMYPADIEVSLSLGGEGDVDTAALRSAAEAAAVQSGRKVELLQDYTSLTVVTVSSGNSFLWIEDVGFSSNVEYADMTVLTAAEYGRLTGETVTLEPDQVLVHGVAKTMPETFFLGDTAWRVERQIEDWPVRAARTDALSDTYYLVVTDEEVLQDLYARQAAVQGEHTNTLPYRIFMDIDGTDEERRVCAEAVQAAVWDAAAQQGITDNPDTRSRAGVAYDYYGMYGGFLFLGLFLGLLFLMTTVLIIYYKQVSEGYEDRRRFTIMQQVGMSVREVRASIRSQVLLVFFLPLGMAGLHILAAFPMITRLLKLFSLTNVTLFALCTVGALVLFCGIYALVYGLTARTYYKIVQAA